MISGVPVVQRSVPRRRTDETCASLLLVNALLSMMAILYGLDFDWPGPWRGLVYRSGSVIWLCGLAAVFILAIRRRPVADMPGLDRLTLGVSLWQLILTLFFNLPTRWALVAILALVSLATMLWRLIGPAAALAGVMAAGTAFWLAVILGTPFGSAGGDMLPFIVHAIDRFRSGADPYLADYSHITGNPFFYPPLQWLVFLTFRAAGLDVRILSLLCAVGMLLSAERAARDGVPLIRAGLYPILLSPIVLPMMRGGQVWPYWAAMLAFALLIARQRIVLAAVAIALGISVRQTALIPAAAVFLALIGRVRPAILLTSAVVGAATIILATVPFAPSWQDWRIMLVDGPALALRGAHEQGNPSKQIALSNLIDWFGFWGVDAKAEAALAVLTIILTRFAARRGVGPMLAAAGLGYAVTISANPYLFRYYYVAGLILWGVSLATPTRPFAIVSRRS